MYIKKYESQDMPKICTHIKFNKNRSTRLSCATVDRQTDSIPKSLRLNQNAYTHHDMDFLTHHINFPYNYVYVRKSFRNNICRPQNFILKCHIGQDFASLGQLILSSRSAYKRIHTKQKKINPRSVKSGYQLLGGYLLIDIKNY